jgi:hypothetical protein
MIIIRIQTGIRKKIETDITEILGRATQEENHRDRDQTHVQEDNMIQKQGRNQDHNKNLQSL